MDNGNTDSTQLLEKAAVKRSWSPKVAYWKLIAAFVYLMISCAFCTQCHLASSKKQSKSTEPAELD